MGRCFIFKPCKGDNSFKIVPKKRIKRDEIIKVILKNFNGKVVVETSFLTIIDIGVGKVTINKNGEMILRDISRWDAEVFSSKLMSLVGGEE